MTSSYEDIINLPRPVSKTRPRMPTINRAAQFAPFAALTGHEAAIQETARWTDRRIELDEYMQASLNIKLLEIGGRLAECPTLAITYFQPDPKKDGGAYITSIGTVRKINEYDRRILMSDGTAIPMDDILSIDERSQFPDPLEKSAGKGPGDCPRGRGGDRPSVNST
jgi:hypothetical protein